MIHNTITRPTQRFQHTIIPSEGQHQPFEQMQQFFQMENQVQQREEHHCAVPQQNECMESGPVFMFGRQQVEALQQKWEQAQNVEQDPYDSWIENWENI